MPHNARLHAILASLLPLLPLLFPDEPDDSEVDLWPWVAAPFPKARIPQYISASFSIGSIPKDSIARELNASLTPEILDALTESWDDPPPVFEALDTIWKSLHHYIPCLNILTPSRSIGAAIILLVAVVVLPLFSRRKWKPPGRTLGPPVLAILDDATAALMGDRDSVMSSTCGEQARVSVSLLSAPVLSRPQAPLSSQSVITLGAAAQDLVPDSRLVAAPSSLHMPDRSQPSVLTNVERASSIQTLVLGDSPCRPRSPSLPRGTTTQEASPMKLTSGHDVDPPATVHIRAASPVFWCSDLASVQSALLLENCSTSQLACHVGSPSLLRAGEEQDGPPRSSWSLEKACEKAPFECDALVSHAPDGYWTAPSSPQPQPQSQPHAVFEPRFFLPQPPIPLTRDQLKAAPPLITDEVINGVPTDVSEKTEEPESESDHGSPHGSPSTPRARWFSGIRGGRLAMVDDSGITYGAKKRHPTDGVMSSPETDTFTGFQLMMPQPLLGVVAPSPLLTMTTRESRPPGLDAATDGEQPEDTDHSEDETHPGLLSGSPAPAADDENPGSDSPTIHVLRSDSPNSILTVMPDSQEAQLSEAASAAGPVYAPVDIDASNDARDALEAAEVEDHLSSPYDGESPGSSSRGRSPEPVRLTASVPLDIEVPSAAEAEPSPSLASGSRKGPPTFATAQTPPTRKYSRSHSRRRTSVVIASSGLVGGRPFALTPQGIDYAAEQLEAEVAAGERGRRCRRQSITAEARAKHVDRSISRRGYEPVKEERRNHLEHVPARVDRDILDGARYPPLASGVQERRAVCEIGRSRTKTIARSTSSVRLEATPASASRSRSASVGPSSKVPRATSEPPMQRVGNECPARDNTVPNQGKRPPKLGRTSYSDIVAQSKSRESCSRTQSERPLASVSAASSAREGSTTVEDLPTEEQAVFDRKGKGCAIDETAAEGVPTELACFKPSSPLSNSASDFSSFVPSRVGPVRKDSVDLKAGTSLRTYQLRVIAQRSIIEKLLRRGESEHVYRAIASTGSLADSSLGDTDAASSAPLRLPAATCNATDSTGDYGFSTRGLSSQIPAAHEQDLSEPAPHRQDKRLKSITLPPRRDRLPSALATPAFSFAVLGDHCDETQDLIATSRGDIPWSPSLGSSVTVRLGSLSSLTSIGSDFHIRQSSAPTPCSPDVPTTFNPFSPSVSQAGFSSDEGEQVLMRPDVPASSSWIFATHKGTDAGTPNRGHQTVPQARRRASTNTMSAQAAGEPSTWLTGGRFDGMKRNVLIH